MDGNTVSNAAQMQPRLWQRNGCFMRKCGPVWVLVGAMVRIIDLVSWLVTGWPWRRALMCRWSEMVAVCCLSMCPGLGHHNVCVDDAWAEQLDSCPEGLFIMLEANEKMPLNG